MKHYIIVFAIVAILGGAGYIGWQWYQYNQIEVIVQKEVDSVVEAMDSAIAAEPAANQSGKTVSEGGEPVPDGTFNLEKTVRMLHVLSDGYEKAGSMEKYLDFLAKQDYRGIPREILEAKKKIIPLYANIRKAEEKIGKTKDNNFWKALVNTDNIFDENSPIAQALAKVIQTDPSQPDAIQQLINQGLAASKELYQNIEDDADLVDEAREALKESKDAYNEYLYEFTPLYVKYMTEWSKMCDLRDRAYLSIRNNDVEGALGSLNMVLSSYPNDRESMILKAYCLIAKLQKNKRADSEYGYSSEIRQLLKDYMDLYPDQTAPALVLQGSMELILGNESAAKTSYDMSAKEYPRQAQALQDMYESYKYRNYLTKSQEGSFVTEMYKSTMEGFGFFSPNFQKAIFAYNKGNFEDAKNEILMHFFRRGNQEFYDYMISDMVYVEQSMPEIFDMIFGEHAYLDLKAYNPTLSFSDKLAIEVENRSDRKISNVRLFVCLHLTDMYKDDYVVQKVETTVNNILPHSKANFGKIQLDYEMFGKKKNKVSDIVLARAILMTDDVIIWVDQDSIKMNSVTENLRKNSKLGKAGTFDSKKKFAFEGKTLTGADVINGINDKITFDVKKAGFVKGLFGGNDFVIHFPRMVDCINPYFSFDPLGKMGATMPESVVLNGNTVDVTFKYNSDFKGKTLALYVTSENGAFTVDVSFDEKGEPVAVGKIKL